MPVPPSSNRLPAGRHLFSFVIIADTHVNEGEDTSTSPYATNARANGRARHALQSIAALKPEPAFVVHLGDIVHPVPSLPTYEDAVARYKALAAAVRVPVHLVPGNHDIGDKSVDWMPADIVCDEYIAKYRAAFGPDWYGFDAGPLRCLVVDALLLNSGLAGEAAQREWLEGELGAAAAGRRTFVFIHYPPYVHLPDERSTYDNIDQPGRDWLLGLLRRHGVEALFAGHVHNFWYDLHGTTEMYLLPSTAFLRHDYSEFYRVPPGHEGGRGDAGKFGWAVVDVHERGHVLRLVRTDGRSLGPDEVLRPRRTVPPTTAKVATVDNVGVELRHAWTEVAEIPSTGGVQEFGRKRARNDYPVMLLWEMGARLVKVPDHDVTDPHVRGRMELLRGVGHRFVATSLGVPRAPLVEAMLASPDLVDAVEVNLTAKRLPEAVERLRAFRRDTGRPVHWAKLRMHEDEHVEGGRFSHFVRSGFLPSELESVPGVIAAAGARDAVDGIVVRLERGVEPVAVAPALAAFAARTGLAVTAAIKLADASLAVSRDDDLDTARLAAEAVLAGHAFPGLMLLFDTFEDIDRGYHPRNGFVDRMFNPRPALRAFAAMAHALAGAGEVELEGAAEAAAGERAVRFRAGGIAHVLVSGSAEGARQVVRSLQAPEVLDLAAGEYVDAPAAGRGLWLASAARRPD